MKYLIKHREACIIPQIINTFYILNYYKTISRIRLQVKTAWWRHQMKTFSALLALCTGTSPVTDEFASQRPVTRRFDVSFDLRLNKRLSKQSWGWWFETPSPPLWRHCNDATAYHPRQHTLNGRNLKVYIGTGLLQYMNKLYEDI